MFQSVSEDIIKKALAMYTAKDTRYLRDAQINRSDDSINLIATFSIDNCCYAVPNSGHFNAIEAIICLNQMFYVALLGCRDRLPGYDDLAIDDFDECWQKVYTKVYISEFETIKFRKLIDSSSFYGKLTIHPRHKLGDKMYGDCDFGFGNDKECKSFTGHIKGLIPILG